MSKVTFKVPLSKRSDFTKTLTCSPPSTKYMHKSFFQKDPRKGKSFGTSRDRSPDRSYFIPQLQQIPGPGQVKNNTIFSTMIKSQEELLLVIP